MTKHKYPIDSLKADINEINEYIEKNDDINDLTELVNQKVDAILKGIFKVSRKEQVDLCWELVESFKGSTYIKFTDVNHILSFIEKFFSNQKALINQEIKLNNKTKNEILFSIGNQYYNEGKYKECMKVLQNSSISLPLKQTKYKNNKETILDIIRLTLNTAQKIIPIKENKNSKLLMGFSMAEGSYDLSSFIKRTIALPNQRNLGELINKCEKLLG